MATRNYRLTLSLLSATVLLSTASWSDEDPPPEGVEILLPRGAIAAVFEPGFVSTEEAEVPDHAIVLGVTIGDQATAYSLDLLNAHEIVNDEMAGTAFAAVW